MQVLGDGTIELDAFVKEMETLADRFASIKEQGLLKKHAFIGASSSGPITMVPVSGLVNKLKLLDLDGVEHTLACLEELPPLHGGSVRSASSSSIFPDSIPGCGIEEELLWKDYSLSATAPHLTARGTKWAKQVKALRKYKTNPPLSSHGKVSKVGATSLELMLRSLDEFVGYVYMHHGVEPTMDLVMQPKWFSKFMAFKVARGNAASTMMRGSQQVSLVVPFVLSGHCPLVQTWGAGHAAQVKQWYSNLKMQHRGATAITPAKRSPVGLADMWVSVDATEATFMKELQVGVWKGGEWGEWSGHGQGGNMVAWLPSLVLPCVAPQQITPSRSPSHTKLATLPTHPCAGQWRQHHHKEACTELPQLCHQGAAVWQVPAPCQGRGHQGLPQVGPS